MTQSVTVRAEEPVPATVEKELIQVRSVFMEPGLALIATVVDRSGDIVFMSNGTGSKAVLRQTLRKILSDLGPEDQLAIAV